MNGGDIVTNGGDIVTISIYLLLFFSGFIVLFIGYAFGKKNEQKHLVSLAKKEKELQARVRILQTKRNPFPERFQSAAMVTGSVVIANDSFKKFLAKWRNIFGGELKSYHSLLSRGRREAIVRAQEEALAMGADTVINIRLETMSISKGRQNGLQSIEVLAYGTALIPKA